MLLYRVLGEANDLPESLRAAIETALRGDMVAAPNQPEAELESADPDTLSREPGRDSCRRTRPAGGAAGA